MILPFYGGVPKLKKRPMTWFLLLTNVAVFIVTFNIQLLKGYELSEMFDRNFLVSQGRMFAQMISDYPKYYSDLHRDLAFSTLGGNRERALTLGQLALGDDKFKSLAGSYQFRGDEVEVKYWRANYNQLQNLRDEHPNFILGISSGHHEWYNWISYSFVHAGFAHLLGNMWFLLVAGAMVEGIMGAVAYLIFFLFSGVASAVFYFSLAGVSAIPLVGASGAISSLIAFYSVYNWNRSLRYLSVLFFFRKDLAVIYLPAWTGFLYWLFTDLAGYLSQVQALGGVAHAAHLGGAFVGVGFGFLFRWRKSLAHGVFGNHSRI